VTALRPDRCAALALACAALAAAPVRAGAQTMLDQELRLVELHSLLVALPALAPPGAWRGGQASLGLELVTIPEIDGTTGGKVQITASDRTRLYPRPRLSIGLPAPEGFRAFAGLSYIPPIEIRDVSTHYVAAEAGLGLAVGVLRLGARGHALYARSRSPVTDPATKDELETTGWGADLSVGARFVRGSLALEPYAGGGVVSVHGRFTVTSDDNVLESDHTGAALHAGVRMVFRSRVEAVAEVAGYPERLVHANVRVGWLFEPFGG